MNRLGMPPQPCAYTRINAYWAPLSGINLLISQD
jgi:hypothetical protein